MRILVLIVISLASLGNVVAQALDISSGGTPTITGSLGGSVSGPTTYQNDLAFNVNLGEVSPSNTNGVIKVILPVGIRSNQPYQVTATLIDTANSNPQALGRSDIGFGAMNLRVMGPQAQTCTTPHIFLPLINADPTSGMSINASGRVAYTSSLNVISTSTVILSGPRLTHNANPNRQSNDGWVFDVILAVVPQYYAAGSKNLTIVFNISAGPSVPC